MNEEDKYVKRAKRLEKRVLYYANETEKFTKELGDKTISLIEDLLSINSDKKKKGGINPPFCFSLAIYF